MIFAHYVAWCDLISENDNPSGFPTTFIAQREMQEAYKGGIISPLSARLASAINCQLGKLFLLTKMMCDEKMQYSFPEKGETADKSKWMLDAVKVRNFYFYDCS